MTSLESSTCRGNHSSVVVQRLPVLPSGPRGLSSAEMKKNTEKNSDSAIV